MYKHPYGHIRTVTENIMVSFSSLSTSKGTAEADVNQTLYLLPMFQYKNSVYLIICY